MENGKRELACEKGWDDVRKLELNLRRRTIWSLCICISDNNEVATIALQFQSRLTSLVVQWRQRHLLEIALHVQSICFAFFLVWRRGHDCAELVVALPRKTILDMRRFRLKNPRFDGKRATKSTSAGTHTHTEAQSGLGSTAIWSLKGILN